MRVFFSSKVFFKKEPTGAGGIKKIISQSIDEISEEEVAGIIDRLKDLCFYGASFSGLSVSVFDCMIVDQKQQIINQAEKEVEKIEKNFNRSEEHTSEL